MKRRTMARSKMPSADWFSVATIIVFAISCSATAFCPMLPLKSTSAIRHRSIYAYSLIDRRCGSTTEFQLVLPATRISRISIPHYDDPSVKASSHVEEQQEQKRKSINPTPVLFSIARDFFERNRHNHTRASKTKSNDNMATRRSTQQWTSFQ